MNNYGKLIAADTLQFERLLPGPIERVWEYLVDGEKRGKWFASGHLDLLKGGEMTLLFDNSNLSPEHNPAPEKYAEYCDGSTSSAVVLDFVAPRMLKIKWEGIVTFELSQIGENVKLVLTHEKLKHTPETKVGTLAGWHTHLDILRDHLDGKTPKGFWSVHMPLENEYATRIS